MRNRVLFTLGLFALAAACTPEIGESVDGVPEAGAPVSGEAQAQAGAAAEDAVARDADGRPLAYRLIGQKLPEFTAPISTGGTFQSADISRWTVIHVWGAWCHDSVADGKNTEALRRAIGQDPDLDFVSLHVPQNSDSLSNEDLYGDYGSLDGYFESAGYKFPVALDADGTIRKALRIDWTPSYLLVSPDGVVRGYRTDLSVDKDQPVKNYIQDIARVRGEVRKAQAPTISNSGAMGVSGAVPFTLIALEAAFPGHKVVAGEPSGAKDPVPVFEVYAPGATSPRFVVEPDWSRGFVGLVRTSDPAVEGPNGIRIGSSRYSDLRQESVIGCTPRGAGGELAITCQSAADLPRLQLEFKADGGGAPMLVEMTYLPATPAP